MNQRKYQIVSEWMKKNRVQKLSLVPWATTMALVPSMKKEEMGLVTEWERMSGREGKKL